MILDKIINKRKIQLEKEMLNCSFNTIRKLAEKSSEPCRNFKKALSGEKISIIAEVKKASPSKGIMCTSFDPVAIAKKYEKSGADAISCLTENYYFQGKSEYLKEIHNNVSVPILRKDFIIDEYQIYESKTLGADAILLIAAVLDTETLKKYKSIADSLDLKCLFEVHNDSELSNVLQCEPEILGINNRDLKTFEIDLAATAKLSKNIPVDCILVSESGITNNSDMIYLKNNGANAVLIGETLMKSSDITAAIGDLRRNT